MANELERIVNNAAVKRFLENERKAREDKAQAIAEFRKKIEKFLPNPDEWEFYPSEATFSGKFQHPGTGQENLLHLRILEDIDSNIYLKVSLPDCYLNPDHEFVFSSDALPDVLIDCLVDLVLQEF